MCLFLTMYLSVLHFVKLSDVSYNKDLSSKLISSTTTNNNKHVSLGQSKHPSEVKVVVMAGRDCSQLGAKGQGPASHFPNVCWLSLGHDYNYISCCFTFRLHSDITLIQKDADLVTWTVTLETDGKVHANVITLNILLEK